MSVKRKDVSAIWPYIRFVGTKNMLMLYSTGLSDGTLCAVSHKKIVITLSAPLKGHFHFLLEINTIK